MSLDKLKKKRDSMTEKLRTQLEQEERGGSGFQDDRFWYPQRDDSGNGYAVIRFMPEPVDEDLAYQFYWHHGFQGPGGWYIENSLTTIGQDDPVSDMNRILWNSGNDEYKELARTRKRKLTYVANVLVLHDPKNPENEGKIFLFKYGKKIHDKIKDMLRPEFDDEKPCNPFDFWEGANFKLKIRKVDGQTNYDKAEFEDPSPLFDGDEDKLSEVYDKLYSLKQFVEPDNFKSYEELRQRRDKVIGPHDVYWKLSGETPSTVSPAAGAQKPESNEANVTAHEATKASQEATQDDEPPFDMDDSGGDGDLDKFKELASDDDDDDPFAGL